MLRNCCFPIVIRKLVKLTVIPPEWFDGAPKNFDTAQNVLGPRSAIPKKAYR
jgi:hypothetical protein